MMTMTTAKRAARRRSRVDAEDLPERGVGLSWKVSRGITLPSSLEKWMVATATAAGSSSMSGTIMDYFIPTNRKKEEEERK